jgi:Protein of unknown function (DUF3987)
MSRQEKGTGGQAGPEVTQGENTGHAWGDGPRKNDATNGTGDHPSEPPQGEAYPVGPLDAYAAEQRWVTWQPKDGRKPPYRSTGELSPNPTVPYNQETLAEVRAGAASRKWSGKAGGIGIVVGGGVGYLDLDSCRNPETGLVAYWALEIVLRFRSYTEVSPSETGLKIIFKYTIGGPLVASGLTAKQKDKDKAHQRGFELQFSKHYTTITGRQFENYSELRTVEGEEFEWLDAVVKPGLIDGAVEKVDLGIGDDERELEWVKSALDKLDPDDNQFWINQGYAIKHRFRDTAVAEQARQAWIDWLQTKDPAKFAHRNAEMDVGKRYNGLKVDGRISIASVFGAAIKAGWPAPWHTKSAQGQDAPNPDEGVEAYPLEDKNRPAPMEEAGYYGLLGDIVKGLLPTTEAGPEPMMFQLVGLVGNAMDRICYVKLGPKKHYPVFDICLIGNSFHGKKGTALDELIENALRKIPKKAEGSAIANWYHARANIGKVSTPQGVIKQICNRIEIDAENSKGEPIKRVVEPGSEDKRLMIIEREFGSLLEMMKRYPELSPFLRDLVDCPDEISFMIKGNKDNYQLTATGPHVSLIGHITPEELREKLPKGELTNGLANRILWVYAAKSKEIRRQLKREQEEQRDQKLRPLLERLEHVVLRAMDYEDRNGGEVRLNDEADEYWDTEVYNRLTPPLGTAPPSMVSERGMMWVMRIALVLALCEDVRVITRAHLDAALAMWDYAEATAIFQFPTIIGTKSVDDISAELRGAGKKGLTRTEIRKRVGSRASSSDIEQGLKDMEKLGMAKMTAVKRSARGPLTQVWHWIPKRAKGD